MARDDDFEEEDRPRKPRRRDDDLDDRPPPKKGKTGLILGIVGAVLLLLCCGGSPLVFYGVVNVRTAANRMKATNNLKQIGLGADNYESVNGGYPTNSYRPDGKALLSWRVHILPYIEQDTLYKQFHLDEAWDSPHNKTLLAQMPSTYATPGRGDGPGAGKTYYRAFATPGALMDPAAARRGGPRPAPVGVKRAEVTDSAANTLFCVEAGEAVDWSKPDDLPWVFGQPVPAFGADRDANEFLVCFADGSVRAVSKKVAPDQLKGAITYAGNDTANLD